MTNNKEDKYLEEAEKFLNKSKEMAHLRNDNEEIIFRSDEDLNYLKRLYSKFNQLLGILFGVWFLSLTTIILVLEMYNLKKRYYGVKIVDIVIFISSVLFFLVPEILKKTDWYQLTFGQFNEAVKLMGKFERIEYWAEIGMRLDKYFIVDYSLVSLLSLEANFKNCYRYQNLIVKIQKWNADRS